MPVIPTHRLTYFDIFGRAETARLMYHDAGVEFTDDRVQFQNWQTLKPTTPMGQLPVLEFNGKKISQSGAINRFLAKLFGYYGADDWTRAKVDEQTATATDKSEAMVAWFREKDPAKKKQLYQDAMENTMKPYFQQLDEMLSHSKSGWLVGNDITVADFTTFSMIDMFSNCGAYVQSGGFDVSVYPHLQKHFDRIANRPNIKKYRTNRPKRDI